MKDLMICCVCWALVSCCLAGTDAGADAGSAPADPGETEGVAAPGVPGETGVTLKYVGPGSGGSMFGVDFQPGNPRVMVVGGDMGAMYRTRNGGGKWEIVGDPNGRPPGRGGVWTVIFDRRHPNIVWSGGDGAFKSMDGGRSWREATHMKATIGAIGIDPDDSEIVYIAEGFVPRIVIGWTQGRVWKTTDGGETWTELARPAGDVDADSVKSRNYSVIIVDPNSPMVPGQGHARLYLAGRGGLYRSDNGGTTWTDLSRNFAPGQTCDLRLVNNAGTSILLLTVFPVAGLAKGGVYTSVDNGCTWTPVNKGLEPLLKRLQRYYQKLVEDRDASFFAGLMLAHSPQNPRRLYVGSGLGIARSDDLGETWRELVPASAYVKDAQGQYVAALKDNRIFAKSLWGGIDAFQRFTACATNADIVAFTDNQDIYRSLDGGRTWTSLSFDYGREFDPHALSASLPPNRYTHTVKSRGVQNIVCTDVAVDPFAAQTRYAAYMDLGLQISRDGGAYWAHVTRGTPSRGHAWAVAVDPAHQGRVFLSIGECVEGGPGGLFRSEDSGESWRRVEVGADSTGKIAQIVIDTNSPAARRWIYLATSKKGLWKSTDGGETWRHLTALDDGRGGVYPVVVQPGSSRVIYAGTSGGAFRSADAGATWRRLGQGVFEKTQAISVCASNPARVYVCAHLPGDNGYWGKAAIFRSDDAGNTWNDITPSCMVYAGAVAANPWDPDYLYACTNLITSTDLKQQQVLMRSRDGGRTWAKISGALALSRARHIILDPQDPRHFFVLTRFSMVEGWDRLAPTGGAASAGPAGN